MKRLSKWIPAALMILAVSNGCKKDDTLPPSISLRSGSSYTPSGSVVAVGGKLKFGLDVKTGDENITNLLIKKIMPDGTSKTVMDSGMNSSSFSVDVVFYQNIEDTAQWTFQVMDKNRLFGTTSRLIYKDPASEWGGILEYSSVTLGYQENTENGHFFCPSTGKITGQDSAEFFQEDIDLAVCFFEDENLPSPTFSSPGEYGGGILEYYPFISGYTTKNYTKYDISVDADPIPEVDFEACHNDSLLIVSYDDVWGKRKFKWSDPGDVIPFMTNKGKKGLIRVLAADHATTGTITFSLKIQQ